MLSGGEFARDEGSKLALMDSSRCAAVLLSAMDSSRCRADLLSGVHLTSFYVAALLYECEFLVMALINNSMQSQQLI